MAFIKAKRTGYSLFVGDFSATPTTASGTFAKFHADPKAFPSFRELQTLVEMWRKESGNPGTNVFVAAVDANKPIPNTNGQAQMLGMAMRNPTHYRVCDDGMIEISRPGHKPNRNTRDYFTTKADGKPHKGTGWLLTVRKQSDLDDVTVSDREVDPTIKLANFDGFTGLSLLHGPEGIKQITSGLAPFEDFEILATKVGHDGTHLYREILQQIDAETAHDLFVWGIKNVLGVDIDEKA